MHIISLQIHGFNALNFKKKKEKKEISPEPVQGLT